jgi:hypothetical protein
MDIKATLSSKTVAELRKLAAQCDIAGRSTMKKSELIRELIDPDIADLVELKLSIDETTPEQQTASAEQYNHAAAVAQMRANIDAEEERKAAARRARNRTNYAPAPAEKSDVVSDSVAAMIEQDAPERIRFDDDDETSELPDPDGSNTLPIPNGPWFHTNEVAILRDAPGRAIVTAAFDGRTVGGSIVRTGRRYMLTAGLITIKANSLVKLAKLFANRLGFHADVIDIDRAVC